MYESLLNGVRNHAAKRSPPFPFGVASAEAVAAEEAALGFALPGLLRAALLHLGNGGFGPGRGGNLIGVRDGYASDFGSLAETFEQLRRDQTSESQAWQPGLLPFCEWGCSVFSCVRCDEPRRAIYSFDEGDISPEGYGLDEFFQMWGAGVDILASRQGSRAGVDIVNPFTGKKARVSRRRG